MRHRRDRDRVRVGVVEVEQDPRLGRVHARRGRPAAAAAAERRVPTGLHGVPREPRVRNTRVARAASVGASAVAARARSRDAARATAARCVSSSIASPARKYGTDANRTATFSSNNRNRSAASPGDAPLPASADIVSTTSLSWSTPSASHASARRRRVGSARATRRDVASRRSSSSSPRSEAIRQSTSVGGWSASPAQPTSASTQSHAGRVVSTTTGTRSGDSGPCATCLTVWIACSATRRSGCASIRRQNGSVRAGSRAGPSESTVISSLSSAVSVSGNDAAISSARSRALTCRTWRRLRRNTPGARTCRQRSRMYATPADPATAVSAGAMSPGRSPSAGSAAARATIAAPCGVRIRDVRDRMASSTSRRTSTGPSVSMRSKSA